MRLRSFPPIVLFFVALLLSPFQRIEVFAQIPEQPRVPREIQRSDISPEFLRKWDFDLNPDLKRPTGAVQKLVRVVYLVPSDKPRRPDYEASVANMILSLQGFYQNEVGNGNRFSLHSPTVEFYQTSHNSAWYSTNPIGSQGSRFFENTLSDGFALSGGGYNDPNNRWLFYIDADPACGQWMGGGSGIAVMSANDLRGLAGEQYVITCQSSPPDQAPVGRWIGGAGHELGHAFGLPHPPGCDQGNCAGGSFSMNSLMWLGFRIYPNTYFLAAEKQALLATGFFSNDFPVSIRGRVTREDGRGLFAVQVSMTDQGGNVRTAMTNPFGYYRFLNVTANQAYTVAARHKWFEIPPRQISPADNLTGIDLIAQ